MENILFVFWFCGEDKKGLDQQKNINRKSTDKYRSNKKEINAMEVTKEFTLKDMMQFAHDIEKMQETLDMAKGLLGDSEIRTIKKEEITE